MQNIRSTRTFLFTHIKWEKNIPLKTKPFLLKHFSNSLIMLWLVIFPIRDHLFLVFMVEGGYLFVLSSKGRFPQIWRLNLWVCLERFQHKETTCVTNYLKCTQNCFFAKLHFIISRSIAKVFPQLPLIDFVYTCYLLSYIQDKVWKKSWY